MPQHQHRRPRAPGAASHVDEKDDRELQPLRGVHRHQAHRILRIDRDTARRREDLSRTLPANTGNYYNTTAALQVAFTAGSNATRYYRCYRRASDASHYTNRRFANSDNTGHQYRKRGTGSYSHHGCRDVSRAGLSIDDGTNADLSLARPHL